jgi:hypothetical protein
MSILEQIMQLKLQGITENEIIRILREQNISPKQINDALSQNQIKNAIGSNDFYSPDMNNMNPSIMGIDSELQPPKPENNQNELLPPVAEGYTFQQNNHRESSEFPSYEQYLPQGETGNAQEPQYPPYTQQQYPSSEQKNFYQPQESFNNNYQSGSSNTDTMIDVAEQVFDEKIVELKKQIQEATELKAIVEIRIKHIEKQLEKIESFVDRLQLTILEKVGSYGNNLKSIKDEMSMMQDSFGKMINPLKEIAEEVQKPHNHIQHTITHSEHTTHKKSKTTHHKKHSKKK